MCVYVCVCVCDRLIADLAKVRACYKSVESVSS